MELKPSPFISVIVPCRNEGRFIGACIRSILANDYPRNRFELLVVDGMSTDETRSVLSDLCSREPNIVVLDNPRLITSTALNIGIRECRGELVAWMSAHNEYQSDYLALCAKAHAEFDADNVGGIIVTRPRNSGIVGRAIANVLTHPFGVGPSHFRTAVTRPRWVDTVFGGCYRREVFERIGLFNEELVRGQDMEFNLRMRRAGLRTLLVPEIRSVYHARSRFGEFLRYNWTNGVWTLKPFAYSKGMPVSLRHLVPMIFVLTLVTLGMLCLIDRRACAVAVGILALYTALASLSAVEIMTRGKKAGEALMTFAMFPVLHLSFGAGCIAGLLAVIVDQRFWRRTEQSAFARV